MENEKISHPNIKDSRLMTYLNLDNKYTYNNTEEENELLQLWKIKYHIAEGEYNKSRANAAKVIQWRKAYEGNFNKLDENGEPTTEKIKAIRKISI